MANTQAEVEAEMEKSQEMSLDDFALDKSSIKVVKTVTSESTEEKLNSKNADGTVGATKIEKEVLANLDSQVDTITKELLNSKTHSEEFKQISSILNRMGDNEINRTSNLSNRMLSRSSIRSMKDNKFGEGDSVAKGLSQLRSTVVNLDPSSRNKIFTKNKLLSFMPFGIGNKVDSYFQEYKSAETQLNDIVKSLSNGKDQLIEDNAFIDEDREQMYELTQKLEQYAYIMKAIDETIEKRLPEIDADDKMKAEDIRQEILFPIRQKRMDLIQHLAVCMQGYMALQVLKRNNVELIRGVDRATKTTIAALRTAVTVSEALGTQKLVLDQINAVNEVTNKMIESTSEQLGRQGLDIQKQATESAVNVATLEKAFTNIFKAMDAMDSYRSAALPAMQKNVEALEATVARAKNFTASRRQERVEDFAQEVMADVTESKEDDIGAVNILNKKKSKKI